ncbi:MAG: type II toxin-antitoxin system PrlF family antitoxin [Candidatus Aerophobetes bacterium]|nr:type II toxin-antitoxin system PrlF family antitoxin [Candidatus Aerophobetes bacterium]
MRTTNITTLTKKGQATIPKRIREYLGIKPNDKIEFEIKKDMVVIKPALNLDLNFGRVKPKKKPEDFKEVRKFFEKEVGKKTAKEV